MQHKTGVISTVACSGRIRSTGRLAVAANAFAAFALLTFEYQSGGHGEMGSFYHSNLAWFLGFAAWGLGTGIGLLRAWPWARISVLIFSALLAASGLVGLVALMRMPVGSISGGMLFTTTILPSLFLLIPIVIAYRWLVFFSRKEVKKYFMPN